jgi:NAD-dependent deacetylase
MMRRIGEKDIAALFDLVAAARYCVALTGAGVSVLSGIRDFRGEDGLYQDGEPDLEQVFSELLGEFFPGSPSIRPQAERIFSIDCFEEDPSLFYRSAGSLVYTVDEKAPSAVHTVLGDLERSGLLKAVITQNFDFLHQRGGSRRVIELHGSPRIHYCLRCAGIRVGYAEAAVLVRAGGMPRCPRCGAVLKPGITFYGERLPLDARRDAEDEAGKADLMLILGTSLRVSPAVELARTTLRWGGKLVIVNKQETPLDGSAVLRFDDLGEVFTGLGEVLSSGVPPNRPRGR